MSAIVVIGNFDGVHRGHAHVLVEARAEATLRGLELMLLSFTPHPRAVLGGSAPPLLTSPRRKQELVATIDAQARVVLHPFDRTYAAQSPSQFAERLRAELDARVVVVGQNFRFGKERAGNFDTLRALGVEVGFETKSLSLLGDESGPFSSTRARKAIQTGDLDEARNVLGRPHMLSGFVGRGKQLGRTIGFPTANLVEVPEVLPPFGIYAVLVEDEASGTVIAKGAMNVGTNPTTDADDGVKVEVFLLDFDGDLYGRRLRVHVKHRLREERKFDSLEALVTQMTLDVAESRRLLEADGQL
jgi:riboflavin kinase/FMN adenylyltransferase